MGGLESQSCDNVYGAHYCIKSTGLDGMKLCMELGMPMCLLLIFFIVKFINTSLYLHWFYIVEKSKYIKGLKWFM